MFIRRRRPPWRHNTESWFARSANAVGHSHGELLVIVFYTRYVAWHFVPFDHLIIETILDLYKLCKLATIFFLQVFFHIAWNKVFKTGQLITSGMIYVFKALIILKAASFLHDDKILHIRTMAFSVPSSPLCCIRVLTSCCNHCLEFSFIEYGLAGSSSSATTTSSFSSAEKIAVAPQGRFDSINTSFTSSFMLATTLVSMSSL